MIFYPLACKNGHFGRNCSQKCSPNCKSDACRHTDGWCTCAAGLTANNCSKGKFDQISSFRQKKKIKKTHYNTKL